MHQSQHRNGTIIAIFVVGMLLLVMLALAGTTWAAPGAQGTVPTPPNGTSAPPPTGGGTNGGGGNGGNNNGGNNGGEVPPPVAPGASGAVCAIGENGAQCSGVNLSVVVGAGAVPAGSALTIEGSFAQPPCPASPQGQNFLNRCYRYTWIGTNALPLTAVSAPVQYCIAYGTEQLASVNNNTDVLLIGFAGADGNWTLVKPTVDKEGGHACATSDQLNVWSALFAPQASSRLLPTVGGQMDWMWLAFPTAFGVLLLLGGMRVWRKSVH